VSAASASAVMEMTEGFWETPDKLIVKESNLPEQIFSVEETSIFWKQMPEGTFIYEEAKERTSFKAFNDRTAVLLRHQVETLCDLAL
jgi:hypothetical protein